MAHDHPEDARSAPTSGERSSGEHVAGDGSGPCAGSAPRPDPALSADPRWVEALAALEREVEARRFAERVARAEAELRESLIRSLPTSFYVFDRQGRFLNWNDAFEDATGRTAAEVVVLHPLDLFEGAERELVAARIAEVFAVGASSVEATLIAKDGARRPYLWTGRRVEVLDSGPCVVGIGLDLSARVDAERSLRVLSRAVEVSGDVVIITDADGTILSVNSEFTRLYGYPRESVIGKATPRLLKSNRQAPEVYDQLWRQITAGDPFFGEFVNRAADGREVVVDVTISPFADPAHGVRGFLAIQRDVTQRKQLEQESARLRSQLAESQKLEALGRLAGGVAHDFNNLLTAIRCHAGLIAEGLAGHDALLEDVEAIAQAAERATDLTGQLLAFSRREVFSPRIVRVHEVIASVGTMLRRLLGASVRLVLDLQAAHDAVLADEGRLAQVLVNLAVNARDAMPDGGPIELSTANVDLPAGERAGLGLADGVYLLLRVRDQGAGMDEATQRAAFEPFFTTKGHGRGTGLGLATVHGIVRQFGGAVRVTSALGQGATFDVLLPHVAADVTAPSAPAAAMDAPSVQGRVLLVEDEPAVRGVIARILGRAGLQVTLAADGVEAQEIVEAAAEEGATPDLVLTDAVMPRMGGAQLSAWLAAHHPGVRVVVMSGFTDDGFDREALERAGHHFVGKPFRGPELVERIRGLLALDRR